MDEATDRWTNLRLDGLGYGWKNGTAVVKLKLLLENSSVVGRMKLLLEE